MIARRGLCLVIAAASGTGKSSLTRALLEAEPGLRLSVSVTTRAPRPREREAEHYFFRTQQEFDAMAEAGELVEWAGVFGRSYGTPRAPILEALEAGQDMVFDIDWQGHRQLRQALPGDVVSLHLLPPSRAELEARLHRRQADHPEEIARRMAQADSEMSHAPECDHIVVNDEFNHALSEIRAILHAARLATPRQTGLDSFLAKRL